MNTKGSSRRKVRIAAGTAGALVTGVLVAVAVDSQGYATTAVDTAQRSVWVTNSQQFMVGRINRQIDELDSAVVIDAPAIDLLQQGDAVILVDHASHSLRALDTSTVTMSGKLAVPDQAAVAMRAGVLTVVDQAAGTVWVRSASGITTGELPPEEVSGQVQPAAQVAVSDAGRSFLASPGGSELAVFARAADGAVQQTAVPIPGAPLSAATAGEAYPVSVTAVGDIPVLLDRPANRVVVGDKDFRLPEGTSGATLQPTGPTADSVLVSTDRQLLRINLSTGETATFDPGTEGPPAAPVWLDGCAHGAWGGVQPVYLSWCGSVPVVRPIPTGGQTASLNTLTFRVNNGVIVLNDSETGTSWVLDEAMTVVNDWEQVAPPKQPDSVKSNTGEQTPSEQFSDTRTDCKGGATPPQLENDTYAIRAGHPSTVRPLGNDTLSECSVSVIEAVSELDAEFGTVSVVNHGRALQITPAEGFTGQFPDVRYTVGDGAGASKDATMAVSVAEQAPPLKPESVRPSGVAVAVGGTTTYNVLEDYFSPSGDPLFLVNATINNPDDRVSYLPGGSITFADKGLASATKKVVSFTVSDGTNLVNGKLTVQVLAEENAVPVPAPVFATGVVDEPVVIAPLRTVISPSLEPLRLTRVTPRNEAAGLVVEPDLQGGKLTVTGGKPGTYYLDFTVAAGNQESDGLIRVDIRDVPADRAVPVATTDVVYMPVGGESLADLVANDIDPAGGVLGLQQVQIDKTSGLVVATSDMHLARVSARRKLPASGAWFSYTVSGGGESATGWVHVIPVPAPAKPAAPLASPISVTVRAGDAVSIPIGDHAVDLGGDVLTVLPFPKDVVPEGQGLLFVSGEKIRYLAPDKGLAKPLRTTYTVANRSGQQDSARLEIRVVPADDENAQPRSPRPVVARAFVGEVVQISVPVDSVDPNGDWAMVTGIDTKPAAGRAEPSGISSVQFTAPKEPGVQTFTYRVADPSGEESIGTVRVGVLARPKSAQPPVAPDLEVSVQPGRSVAMDVLAEVSDPGSLEVSFAEDALSTKVSGDPGITFKVADERVVISAGPEPVVVPVTYTVKNKRGLQASGLITVKVTAEAQLLPPKASDVFVTLPMLSPDRKTATVNVTAAVENPAGEVKDLTLSVPVVSAGRLTVSGDRALTVPMTDHRQVLAYRVTNLDGQSGQAFVVVPALQELVPKQVVTTEEPGEEPVPPQDTPVPPEVDPTEEPVEPTEPEEPTEPDEPTEPQEPAEEPEPAEPEVYTSSETLVVAEGEVATFDIDDYVAELYEPGTVEIVPDAGSASVGDLTGVDENTLNWGVPEGSGGDANVTVTVTDGSTETVVEIPASITPDEPPAIELVSVPLDVEAGSSDAIDVAQLVDTEDADLPATLTYAVAGDGAPVNGVTSTMDGSVLTVTAAESVPVGTEVPVEVTATRDGDEPVTGTVLVTVTGLSAEPARVRDFTISDAAQGEPSTQDVLEGSFNPLESGPLKVVGAVVSEGDAAVEFDDTTVTVIPGAEQLGSVVVVFTVADASGDEARNVEGTLTAIVRGRPGAPGTPSVVSEGNGTATLEWEVPEDNGAPITGYTVSDGKGFTQECPTSPCDLEGLDNGETYTFTVVAHNEVDSSDPSEQSAPVHPDTAPEAPEQPTVRFGDGRAEVTWPEPANDGTPITGYQVHISPAPGQGPATVTVSGTSHTFEGLENGTEYQITVVAQNSSGKDSDPSPPASVIPAGVPDVPTAPAMSKAADAGSTGQVVVSWTAVSGNGDNAITYFVDWTDSDGNSGRGEVKPGGKTAFTIPNAVPGREYTATVLAQNKAGDSEKSPPGSVVPYTAPAQVVDVTASATGRDGEVRLAWPAPNDNGRAVTAYHWHSGDGVWKNVTGTEVLAQGLTNGKEYAFVVRACNTDQANNCGPASEPVSATPYRPSGQVRTLTANADAAPGALDVKWTAPADTGGRPVAGYEYRTAGGPWVDNGTKVSVTISGLRNGTAVTVEVRSYSAEQASRNGASAAVTQTPYAKPSPPTAVRAAATGSSGTARLTWNAGAANGRPLTGYDVSISGGAWRSLVNGAVTSATVSGLANGTNYTFRIRAKTGAPQRNRSDASAPSNGARPYRPVPAPAPKESADTRTSVTFNWPAPANNGIGGYDYSVNGGGWTTSRTFTKAAACGKTVSISVVARDDLGNKSAAGKASGTAAGCPPPAANGKVQLAHGPSAQGQPGCGSSLCQYLGFKHQNIPAGTYTVCFQFDREGSGCWRKYTGIKISGDGSWNTKEDKGITYGYYGFESKGTVQLSGPKGTFKSPKFDW